MCTEHCHTVDDVDDDGENAYTHIACKREMLISFRLRMSVSLFRSGTHSPVCSAHNFSNWAAFACPWAVCVCVSCVTASLHWALAVIWRSLAWLCVAFMHILQRYRRSALGFRSHRISFRKLPFSILPSCSVEAEKRFSTRIGHISYLLLPPLLLLAASCLCNAIVNASTAQTKQPKHRTTQPKYSRCKYTSIRASMPCARTDQVFRREKVVQRQQWR